ncbi:hypothetical protein HMPREF0662_01197 [Prevotella nigrescens F0103]|nr:hypothetical protein HMPREF0662_01197 [Prevotella nigrescens F0103]
MHQYLTCEQRYAICLEKQKKQTHKAIRDKANALSQSRMHRALGNHAVSQSFVWHVKELITGEQWSPKQISGYLAKVGVKISHETIYKMIRNNANGTLAANCRHKIRYRHSPRYRHETKAPGIRNRVSIYERPKEADGSWFGDWRWA